MNNRQKKDQDKQQTSFPNSITVRQADKKIFHLEQLNFPTAIVYKDSEGETLYLLKRIKVLFEFMGSEAYSALGINVPRYKLVTLKKDNQVVFMQEFFAQTNGQFHIYSTSLDKIVPLI